MLDQRDIPLRILVDPAAYCSAYRIAFVCTDRILGQEYIRHANQIRDAAPIGIASLCHHLVCLLFDFPGLCPGVATAADPLAAVGLGHIAVLAGNMHLALKAAGTGSLFTAAGHRFPVFLAAKFPGCLVAGYLDVAHLAIFVL